MRMIPRREEDDTEEGKDGSRNNSIVIVPMN
jgi:hypothetical protein